MIFLECKMFGANRISENVFLVSLVLDIFVILIIFASCLKRFAAWSKLWTVESIDWLVVKSSKKPWVLDTCIFSSQIVGEGVKSIFTNHFTLSWLLFKLVWFKKMSPFFVSIQILPTHPTITTNLHLSTGEYCKRNANEQVLKARAPHLMGAFLNTCSEFYMEKTDPGYPISPDLLTLSNIFSKSEN